MTFRHSAFLLIAASLVAAVQSAAAGDGLEFQSVVVKPGDTLWSIADKYLKDPANWDQILKYNRLPSSDPTLALPGMTLRVPVRLIREDLRAARLVDRVNDVVYRRKATAVWKAASDNMELFRDDTLKTSQESSARVKFLDGDLLQLDANSMAVIKPLNKDYAAELKRGGVFVGKAKIMTAAGKITPLTKDTKYSATVRDDLSTLVEVFKGKASVEAEGLTREVGSGMASEIKFGSAPSLPSRIPDLPQFEARLAAFGKGPKAAVTVPDRLARVPVTGMSPVDLRSAVQVIGQAISGYRIQLSTSRDFSAIVFDTVFPEDEPIRASAIRVPPGTYWYRIAVIDLLGTQGRYSEPAPYPPGTAR